MKKMRPIVVALSVAGFMARAAAAEVQVPPPGAVSKISSVAVYTDRAVVTRTAELDIAAGTREIVFERLPATLLDESLQVSGQGAAEATILDVTARQTFVEAAPNERVKALEDDIDALQKQMRVLSDRAATLSDERDFVRRMTAASTSVPTAPGGGGTRPSLEEWQHLYSYSDEATAKIAAEIRSLDEQKTALDAKKSAFDRQLAELRGARGRSFKTVVVRLTSARAGHLQLAVAYTVPNASWSPSYDVRLHSDEHTVELSYFGVVRQNTGEDWENVSLTLSTARPSLGGGAPELSVWIVDVQRGRTGGDAFSVESYDFGKGPNASLFGTASAAGGGRAANGTGSQRNFYDQAAVDSGLTSATFNQAAVDSGATSATFKVAAPASLKSDASAQKVAITTARLPATLLYQSTPKMREAAYLNASAVNSTDFPFLAGAMNTFLDNVFVATSSLKTVMSGEKFDLALGADEGIGIKRKLVNRFTEDTGLTSKGRRVTYEYLVTVTNNKKTAETVVFREPVPVSRDEKIVVKLLAPLERDIGTVDKPKDIVREADGKLAWHLPLKPGEKREIALKLSVEYPADISVTGLE